MDTSGASIHLVINGEPHLVPFGQRLPDLIRTLGLPPQAALVEHNGQALLRDEWDQVSLAENDRLEILRVVAGG